MKIFEMEAKPQQEDSGNYSDGVHEFLAAKFVGRALKDLGV